MKPSRLLLTITILLFTTLAYGCKDEKKETITQIDEHQTTNTTICTVDGSHTYNEYVVVNNCWGKGTITNFLQCIYVKTEDSNYDFGFNWQWPTNINNDVKAYPEIIYGWKPWSSSSTTPKLPVIISAGKKIIVSFDSIKTTFNGVGNTAFDIWLTSSNTPSTTNITRELMIWTKNFGQYPAGSKVTTTTIDGVTYDFYKGQMDWSYYAFVKTSSTEVTTYNIDKFISYLTSLNLVTQNEYVAAIEFGNEVISGTGNTNIKNYKVRVE